MNFTYGNRCGHSPSVLRGYRRPEGKAPPGFITGASRRMEGFYWHPLKKLLKLRFVNEADSQQRSERREAITAVGQVMINYFDLITFGVGIPKKHHLNFLSISEIAAKAALPLKRTYRALKDLERAGYISIKRQVVERAERFKQTNEISLKRQFFLDLGMSNASLEHTRAIKFKKEGKDLRRKQSRSKPDFISKPIKNLIENGKMGIDFTLSDILKHSQAP